MQLAGGLYPDSGGVNALGRPLDRIAYTAQLALSWNIAKIKALVLLNQPFWITPLNLIPLIILLILARGRL